MKINKMKKVLIELDKGDYDNFTDKSLLTQEIMRDFNLSHSVSIQVVTAFWHYRKDNKILDDFEKQLEDAKAQGFREAIKEMGKVKG